jgi:transposase
VIADGLGRVIAFALAPGQAHELPLAPGLLGCLPDIPGWVVGDRGYAADAFRERIWDLGARPAIPPRHTDAPVACPELDLPESQSGRAALGATEGMACRRHPLRKDRAILHGCPLPRRSRRLDQVLTGPSVLNQKFA